MFTELGDLLKEKYLVVRFDYTIVNDEENWTKVYQYSIQKEMLRTVYDFVIDKFSPKEVNIIAHSMGCLITGLARLGNIKKTILLAGPPSVPYSRMKEYFSKRPETKIDENGTSIIKRSDGSLTYVDKDFWKEMQIVNPPHLYRELSKNSDVTFARAMKDQVITESEYSKITDIQMIKHVEIDGNHDFEGEARDELKGLVEKIFS